MNIVQSTPIEDIHFADNTDTCKVFLMDEVINHFLPLFRDEIERKKAVLNKYQEDFKKLSFEVDKTRKSLLKFREELGKEKIIEEILDEATFLFSRDILYGKNKKVVLDILDTIREDTLVELSSKFKTLRAITQKHVTKVNIN